MKLLSKAEFQLCLPKPLHFYLLHPAISALRSRGLSKPGSGIPCPETPQLRSPKQQPSSADLELSHPPGKLFSFSLKSLLSQLQPNSISHSTKTSSPSFPLSITGKVFNSPSVKMVHHKFSIFTCNPFMSTQANQSIFQQSFPTNFCPLIGQKLNNPIPVPTCSSA